MFQVGQAEFAEHRLVGSAYVLVDRPNILIVLESGPILTTQTNVRPTHVPDLKNEVCGAIRLVRFSPASGSIASSASSGNVITWPSDKGSS